MPCELCTFVLSIAKQMLDAKHTEVRSVNLIDLLLRILLQDKVLLYIDEQVCSRLIGTAKKNCKEMVDVNGRDLIKDIQSGTVSEMIRIIFKFYISIFSNQCLSVHIFNFVIRNLLIQQVQFKKLENNN